MSELPNVEILSERLIAFFDILGFSDRLRVMPMGELHALYSELIDNVRDTIFEPIATTGELAERRTNFDRADFMFDSIILVSRDLSDPKVRGPAVHNFVSSCSTLMEKSFARQLPLRGCVGLGDYLEDKSRNIFLSRLFADLVSAENNQEWSGCMILPNAADLITDATYLDSARVARAPHGELPILPFDVPTKSGAPSRRWCINWGYFLPESSRAIGMSFLVGAKAKNTSAFATYVDSLPSRNYLLPDRFRPAVRMLAQATRGGMRLMFKNEAGEPVDPAPGQELNIAVLPAPPDTEDDPAT